MPDSARASSGPGAAHAEGLVSKEPIKAIPEKKPWVSSRQWSDSGRW